MADDADGSGRGTLRLFCIGTSDKGHCDVVCGEFGGPSVATALLVLAASPASLSEKFIKTLV